MLKEIGTFFNGLGIVTGIFLGAILVLLAIVAVIALLPIIIILFPIMIGLVLIAMVFVIIYCIGKEGKKLFK